MESKYRGLVPNIYIIDSIHIEENLLSPLTIGYDDKPLAFQTLLMDLRDRVLHVPGAPTNTSIYLWIYMYVHLPCRHRSSIYLSIWSLIDPLTLLCPNSSDYLWVRSSLDRGKHSRVEPITYSVEHTINNLFWCQLPWAGQCIICEFLDGDDPRVEWMITSLWWVSNCVYIVYYICRPKKWFTDCINWIVSSECGRYWSWVLLISYTIDLGRIYTISIVIFNLRYIVSYVYCLCCKDPRRMRKICRSVWYSLDQQKSGKKEADQ